MMIQTHLAQNCNRFSTSLPFNYAVIDDFYQPDVARLLSKEFPAYHEDRWHVYKNAIEDKKTINTWNFFDALTYQAFTELSSHAFTQQLSQALNLDLTPDIGLHGGGLHIHSTGGNLNPHLDYSIHPKINMQRKINIIIYLGEDVLPEHGGHLGLWSHNAVTQQPDELMVEIEPKFNRAVIFDTTQNSWHGMSRTFIAPVGVFRKSHAMYYLTAPANDAPERMKALFAPRAEQANDAEVLNQIMLRSQLNTASNMYRVKK
jgi:Rps23 Pro-64 3,4-dihydroxylase Tpa1-like proline 4-hydroxylase